MTGPALMVLDEEPRNASVGGYGDHRQGKGHDKPRKEAARVVWD